MAERISGLYSSINIDWTTKDVIRVLFLEPSKGGIGLTIDDAKVLHDCSIDGLAMNIIITASEEEKDEILRTFTNGHEENSKTIKKICLKAKNLLRLSNQIIDPINEYTWFKISGQYEEKNFNNSFVEEMLKECEINLPSKEYQLEIDEAVSRTNTNLGLMSQNADWPFVIYGPHTQVKLDWRFSTVILPSLFEQQNIESMTKDSNQSILDFSIQNNAQSKKKRQSFNSIHEYIISKVNENKNYIHILFALSGAGKTHTLFYLNTSNNAYTLPIDFGSTEDKGVNISVSKLLGLIVSLATGFKPNEGNVDIQIHNQNICDEITSIIASIFTIRALMLIKYLRICKTNNIPAEPSNWIRFLYSGGSVEFTNIVETLCTVLTKINKKGEFMNYVLEVLTMELNSNEMSKCKKVVLVVDEINPLINLGYGKNQIPTDNTNNGSVITLLLRLLECALTINQVSSIISGTRVNSALLSTVFSTRLKEYINWVHMYGPTYFNQQISFSSKFFSVPNSVSNVFQSVSFILEGRRRAFMNFMTSIVTEVNNHPCPVTLEDSSRFQENYYSWVSYILWKAFSSYSFGEFKKDVSNFLENENSYFPSDVKIDISVLLMLKNRLEKEDVTKVLKLYCKSNDIETVSYQLGISIINNGLAFSRVESNTIFQCSEISNMIYLGRNILKHQEKIETYLNEWLIDVIGMKQGEKKQGKDQNELFGEIFEMIGALILSKISDDLQGSPLSSHPLFAEFQNTLLDKYTLPYPLAIIHNKHYWKVMLMFEKYPYLENDFFRDVCVVGLDQGVKVNVQTFCKHIDADQPPMEVNLAASFIKNSNHEDQFKENYHATNIKNAFLCNDLKTVQQGMEEKRREALSLITDSPKIRILFDYTFNEEEVFNDLKSKETLKDFIVCEHGHFKTEFNSKFDKQILEDLKLCCFKKEFLNEMSVKDIDISIYKWLQCGLLKYSNNIVNEYEGEECGVEIFGHETKPGYDDVEEEDDEEDKEEDEEEK
ncbi:hypothetical protein ABK040_015443 [Willaertia magna]